jgi:iron complex outermembrane receptor protein
MQRLNRLPVVAGFFVFLSCTTLAESAEEADIIVTATRSEQTSVVIPTAIDVISHEEIVASGALHLADVLRGRGGIQLSDLYGDGSRVSIGMRGFGETANANTLILVDGRRLNNPDIADPDLNSVSLKDIERIEIIQGSGGVLYGDQAVGGVINIITRRVDGSVMDVNVTAGSHDRRTFQAYAAHAFDNGVSIYFSGESRQADNYREHNAADYSNGFGRIEYAHEHGELFLELLSVNDYLETPGALFVDEVETDRRQSLPEYANDFSDLQSETVRLGIRQQLSEHWSLLAEAANRDADGRFLLNFRGCLVSFAPCSIQPNRQDRELLAFTPRLSGRYDTQHGPMLLTLGVDHEESEYFLESRFGTQQSDQQIQGFYLQGVFPLLQRLDLIAGFRQTEVENQLVDRPAVGQGVPDDADLDDELSIVSLGINVQAGDNLRHFIRYEENFRFAKVDEHTNSPVVPDFFTGVSGDPLRTQTGESLEVGFDWSNNGHHASLLIYRLELENEIIFDPLSFRNVNLQDTRRDGLVLDAGRQIGEGLRLGLNYAYLDAEIESGSVAGNRVPFVAENIAGLHLDYTLNESWHIFTELQYTDDRVFSGDFANALSELKGYTVANAQLDFSRPGWTFSLRVNNLFDEEYSDSGAAVLDPATFMTVESFYPAPERTAWLKVNYHME